MLECFQQAKDPFLFLFTPWALLERSHPSSERAVKMKLMNREGVQHSNTVGEEKSKLGIFVFDTCTRYDILVRLRFIDFRPAHMLFSLRISSF
jgi:hypothetical protein